jgi:hypothetical protein
MKKDIRIEKLIVNPENYRFDPVDNQDEAIDLMLEEKGEDILNLAKHIFKYGLDKAKDSRVQETKEGLFLILDGNRRATAIKCLNNTSLIKDASLKKRFLKILEEDGSVPKEVNCFVYENEKDAAGWIKLDHTGKNEGVGQDPWGTAEQERFDYKFGGKISPATQLIDLFSKATGKSFRTKDVKISTVNRILSNPEARSYLGIDINKGDVTIIAEKGETISRLGALFTKIIKDDVPVAEVYKTPQAIRFMKDLFVTKPKLSSKKSLTLTSNGTGGSEFPLRKALPKSSSRKNLIPKECVLRISEPKINNIYRELRDDLLIDNTPMATPNAVGVLFRVFLEVSLDYYLGKRCGIALKQDATINQKIAAVTGYMEKNKIATGRQLSPVRSVSGTKKTDILHIQRFHEYVHSTTIQPDASSLKAKWDNTQEFFEILWGDLEKKKK